MNQVFEMPFSKIYPLLIAKAQRKGRTRQEVDAVTAWLTGYTPQNLEEFLRSDLTYGDFFRQAPKPNPQSIRVTGKICGVRVETIADPLMRQIRILDKLVDDLAKGKALERLIG